MHDVEADFGIANVLGCDSMLVDFIDLTVPVSDVNWVFGDGGTSNLNNPQYIYYNEGFYDVTVFAESVFGCKDTLKRVEYIQFQYPTADFSSNIQGICHAIESFEMQVYDRWRSIVFESNSIEYGWDGKNVSGDWANNGLYLYHIATYDRNGRLWVYNGELNLMR